MLNEFKLFAAINESVNSRGVQDDSVMVEAVEPISFVGMNVADAMNESVYLIMDEATCYNEMSSDIDEIITEAAISRNENLDVLTENAITAVTGALGKLLKRLREIVGGIINKLKEQANKLLGRTDAFLKTIKPRLDKATGEVKYSMYEWDTDFLTKGLKDAMSKVYDDWKSNAASTTYKSVVGDATVAYNSRKDKTADDIKDDDIMDKKSNDEGASNIESKLIGIVESEVGVQATNMAELRAAINRHARGGKGGSDVSKTERNITPDKEKMRGFVDGFKNTMTAITKFYADYLAEIKRYEGEVNKSRTAIGRDADNKDVKTAVNAAFKSKIDYLVKYTNTAFSLINTIGAQNQNLLRECLKDYMGALSKIAGAKAPKEDKGAAAEEG